jgi:Domain of unknown function (DUF4191)
MAGKNTAGVTKEARKEAARAKRAESRARRKQLIEAFKMQRREDSMLLPVMIGAFVLTVAVIFGLSLIWGLQWFALPFAIGLGLLLAVLIFGRRVQRNVYAKADGQPGAAAWALENLRGRWRVTPAVAGTTQLDAVHRVIGRPGIVLVAEGAPHRVKTLLAQEKKRVSRIVGETPIYDVMVGADEGQVPLRQLQKHLMKLPRNITPQQMDGLETKLAALGARGGIGAAAMPKGPIPQGAKMRNIQRAVKRR